MLPHLIPHLTAHLLTHLIPHPHIIYINHTTLRTPPFQTPDGKKFDSTLDVHLPQATPDLSLDTTHNTAHDLPLDTSPDNLVYPMSVSGLIPSHNLY